MNVCIVEDSIHIQERLKNLLAQMPDIHLQIIAGDLASASQFFEQQINITTKQKTGNNVGINEGTKINAALQAVILDTQLPDGNSLDLLKSIKTMHPNIKVVVFSNHANEENRLLAMRAGADNFLDKSTDSEQLAPLLQHWHTRYHS